MPFPPLIISTIVENCIKHGLTPGGSLLIDLSLCRETRPEGDCLLFRCVNNGPAFPEDILELINSPEIPEHLGTHIGLAGIKSTLMNQYGRHVNLAIENTATGATVTIRIPLSELGKADMQS